jgi:hypothetical protein
MDAVTPSAELDEDWCSIAEAARRLGVTPAAIHNRIRRGTLPTRPNGNHGKLVKVPRAASESRVIVTGDDRVTVTDDSRVTITVMAGESPDGVSPSGAPRTVHEPLNSHGSRCSAVAIT